jgi:translocator protein
LLALVGFVGLCLLVGAAAAAVTAPSLRTWYLSLTPPPGTPPKWLFAPVWSLLYVLIGVSAWLVWRRPRHRRPLLIWGWQLLCNAAWMPAFFGLHSPALGLCVIVPFLVLIGLTIRAFVRIRPLAAGLMVPYAIWVCYAAYLNAGFWWLNSA